MDDLAGRAARRPPRPGEPTVVVPPARRRTDRSLLDVCLPSAAEVFGYWDRCRGARAMPRRRDIDPVDIPRYLPSITLLDIEDVDGDGVGIYRYRVVGTREVALRGDDPTGKLVQEGYFAESLEGLLSAYETVRRQRTFLYAPTAFWSETYKWIDEDVLMLPLSEDGDTVSQILVFCAPRPDRGT